MGRIEQRRMLWLGRVDERPRGLRSAQLERDRDNLDAEWMQLSAQCLPPGQVETATSIRCPGDEHNLLAAQ